MSNYDDDIFDVDIDDDSELDAILGLISDDEDDDEKLIPKSRVQTLVSKRLEKARRSYESKEAEFKQVYGVTPSEAIALMQARNSGINVSPPVINGVQPNAQPAEPYQSPIAKPGQAWNPAEALRSSDVPAPGARDPRVDTLEQRVMQLSNEKQLESEALEFAKRYPGVTFEQIPVEVRKRREAGGVSLVEAMDMYVGATADTRAAEARKQGAEAAVRNLQRNKGMFSEGANLAGNQTQGEIGFINQEDKTFINGVLGMSDKQFLKAQQRAKKYKDLYGLGE